MSANTVYSVLMVVALVASSVAVGRNRYLSALVRTASENVDAIETARKLDREQCDRDIAELKQQNRTLEAKIVALEANYAAEITKLILEAITKQADVFGQNLQAGQNEILGRLDTIRVAVGSRADD